MENSPWPAYHTGDRGNPRFFPTAVGELMNDVPPFFTRLDISANTAAPAASAAPDAAESTQLLREMVGLQKRSCELLTDLLNQVSLQQRQRMAELKAWKEANPELSAACRRAAESLGGVHTEFLGNIARDAADNADDFADSDYALGEFVDRYGPRLAHFNGIMQLLAQLGAPLPPSDAPTGG